MDCPINGDHVRLSESDISEHCFENLGETQTLPGGPTDDIGFETVKEKIVNSILDTLELHLRNLTVWKKCVQRGLSYTVQ